MGLITNMIAKEVLCGLQVVIQTGVPNKVLIAETIYIGGFGLPFLFVTTMLPVCILRGILIIPIVTIAL